MRNKLVIYQLILFVILLFPGCDTRDYKPLSEKEEKVINNPGMIGKDAVHELQTDNKDISEKVVITHFAFVKTSMGNFTMELYGEDAPETVANFIGLVKMKYYNGLLFHRVAKNFLIQTGDKNTLWQNKKSEWGIGGQSFYGGEIEDELNPNTPSYRMGYVKGTVAMANKGPNTNTSQFFICLPEAAKLEHKWTIFGKVIEGMDVVENISYVPVERSDRGANDGVPVKPVRIHSIAIKLIKAPNLK